MILYLSVHESNASSSKVHATMKFHSSKFMDINEAGYLLAYSKNIFPAGLVLIEKAKEITEQLSIHVSNFKDSRGWLDKWKLRYNIKQVKVHVGGESDDICGMTIDSWKL